MDEKIICAGKVCKPASHNEVTLHVQPTVVAFFIFRKCLISRDFSNLDSYNPLVHIDHQYPWDKTWTHNKRQSK